MKKNMLRISAVGAAWAVIAFGACAKSSGEAKGNSQKNSES